MLQIPMNCPSCDSSLTRVKDQLFCKFSGCAGKQSKQVEKYAKTLKIKGLGEKTIEKLTINSIPEIYSLDFDTAKESIGEKLAEKLIIEIDKARNVHLENYLAAFSIPLVGTTAARKLSKFVDTIEVIDSVTCKKAGLGDKATANLLNWIAEEYVYLNLPVSMITIDKVETIELGITVCITGKFPGYTRKSLQELLESKGVKVTTTVSSKTTYLVSNETTATSKHKKAAALNIKILTLNEIIEVINK